MGRVSVENDEIIAHALQEELSKLSVAESSESSESCKRGQACVLSQNWLDTEVVNRLKQKLVPLSAGGCLLLLSWERLQEPIFWGYLLCLIYLVARLLGGRSRKIEFTRAFPSLQHEPKVNGEIPSVDVENSDHQRLLDRLKLYNLVETEVEGDGNCQFRALSDQFYGSQNHHKFVREQIVTQLKSCPQIYKEYVPMEMDEYLRKMSMAEEWGDHVTLQAAADSYGLKIIVMTSFKDNDCIEILPKIKKSERVLLLSFWAEVHYNSIYPRGD